MSNPTADDVLFRAGGVSLQKYGRPWTRAAYDRTEADAYTFTRADAATCATFVDSDLTLRTAAAGKLRGSWADSNADGTADVFGLLLESSRTNLCLQSEDFGTTWAAIGTPTRSSSAATCGSLSLDLIGDDSGAVAEGYRQTWVTGVVATGVNGFSVFVAAGTTVATCGMVFNDTTASANKVTADIGFSAGVVTVTCTSGSCVKIDRLAGGVYRLHFQTATCLAANAHRLDIYPAGGVAFTAAAVGNIYVGGVQLENAPYPSSYIKTTTVAVTRAADALSFPIGFAPQDMTVYAKVARPAWADVSGTIDDPAFVDIGKSSGGTGVSFVLMGGNATRTLGAYLDTPTTDTTASAALPAGATLAFCGQFATPTVSGSVKVDVGSGFGAASTGATAVTGWTDQRVVVGTGTSWAPMDGLLLDLIVLRGSYTLAECQATPIP